RPAHGHRTAGGAGRHHRRGAHRPLRPRRAAGRARRPARPDRSHVPARRGRLAGRRPAGPHGPAAASGGPPRAPIPVSPGTAAGPPYPPTTPYHPQRPAGRAPERAPDRARDRPEGPDADSGPRRVTRPLAAGMATLCVVAVVAPGAAVIFAVLFGIVARTVERS